MSSQIIQSIIFRKETIYIPTDYPMIVDDFVHLHAIVLFILEIVNVVFVDCVLWFVCANWNPLIFVYLVYEM